jgi:hypothetical protein
MDYNKLDDNTLEKVMTKEIREKISPEQLTSQRKFLLSQIDVLTSQLADLDKDIAKCSELGVKDKETIMKDAAIAAAVVAEPIIEPIEGETTNERN